jgi:hypothetical protein
MAKMIKGDSEVVVAFIFITLLAILSVAFWG